MRASRCLRPSQQRVDRPPRAWHRPPRGLAVLIAEGDHQENVHNALYEELAKGVFLPGTRLKFRAAIADLVSRGAEAVILGCTEFGLLVQSEDSAVPLVDTTIAHAVAAVDRALTDTVAGNMPC